MHKILTSIKFSDSCKEKTIPQIYSLRHSHTDTLPHSFDQKPIIPLKVQMEISTDNSDRLSELKSVS